MRSVRDVAALRRHRIPAYLLTPEAVSEAGYPVSFRPWLLLPERLASQVTSEFRILPVRDEEALATGPGLPELVTFLLRFDPLAARVIASRNRAVLNKDELYRRVRNEHMERQATKVRLQDFCRSLPRVGESLPAEELRWIERNSEMPARVG